MAVTSAITAVKQELAHGMAEWVKSGITLLTELRTFATAHTHTGTNDGALIPATGLTPASITTSYIAANTITNANLSAAAETNVAVARWMVADTAGDAEVPVFWAPVACVITSAAMIPAANIVGNATDYNNLYLLKYTAGVAGGTLCSANSGTSGTLLAYQPKDLGTVTGGTLAAGDVLTLAKSTAAGGTVIGNSVCVIKWKATDA
jgi:hypothetical protein